MTRGELRVGSRETSSPGSAQGALLLIGGQCKEWWTARGGRYRISVSSFANGERPSTRNQRLCFMLT